MAHSLPSIDSSLIDIRDSSTGGRGVFATTGISPGTPVYTTKPTPASVIYRIFRKEVCSWCFAYDLGRTWKITISNSSKELGPVAHFCSEECKAKWEIDLGDAGKHAWSLIEAWLKKAGREPEELVGLKPSEQEIEEAWKRAETTGIRILESRAAKSPAKAHRRVMASAMALPPFPDAISLLLSGILTAHYRPVVFESMLQLEPVAQPYRSPVHLQSHLASYQIMLGLLPESLLPSITPRNLRAIASRDVHNSFGIWSYPGDSTAEMLGFGIWPDASFFNHSCDPNVGTKDRVGRVWHFRASKPIAEGEELFISYLSLEELIEMDHGTRQERLRSVWGFNCGCHRCRGEAPVNSP
jgi:hypothetical protein